jgi:hypothetical protein
VGVTDEGKRAQARAHLAIKVTPSLAMAPSLMNVFETFGNVSC